MLYSRYIRIHNMSQEEKKVLIVEKDTGIANMIRAILGIVSVPVLHARTHNEAMELLKQENIGLIICNKELNGRDGYYVLKLVRENPATNQIPVIMIVAENDRDHEKLSKEEAADRYISKPFTARKVMDVVKEFIVYKGL